MTIEGRFSKVKPIEEWSPVPISSSIKREDKRAPAKKESLGSEREFHTTLTKKRRFLNSAVKPRTYPIRDAIKIYQRQISLKRKAFSLTIDLPSNIMGARKFRFSFEPLPPFSKTQVVLTLAPPIGKDEAPSDQTP